MSEKGTNILNKKKIRTGKPTVQQILFYISFVGLPVIQFCIFYLAVNFKTIIFAFQKYDIYTNSYTFAGFENFIRFFKGDSQVWGGKVMPSLFSNSLILYACTLGLGTTLALMFSSYIYKKRIGAGAFRIILYIPHIVSAISIVVVYKFFISNFTKAIGIGDLYAPADKFFPILFLAVYLSFGNNVLIYTSSMSGISESVVESAELDGCTGFREFIHITLPSIFPTLINFIVAGLALAFTDQMLIYSFVGESASANYSTVGLYLYYGTVKGNPAFFPEISAVGVFLTIVVTTITYIVKYCLNKFGPSVE